MLLLVTVLVIAVGVWLLIAQPWRSWANPSAEDQQQEESDTTALELPVPGSITPTPTPTPTVDAQPTVAPETPSPTPTPTGTADPAAKACIATDILVEPVTDQDTYGSGQNPQLAIRLTNRGATDCTLNVGTSGQVFTITSGSDTWWRSTDCQTEPSDMVVLLKAGQTVSSSQPIVWDRTRSSVSTCQSASRPKAAGGGATYHVQVAIGGVPSQGDTMFLLY